MQFVVVWDCEFLTDVGAPQRFWCGPEDPDPILVQLGAVKLGLEGDFPVFERFEKIVRPIARDGTPSKVSDLFSQLTGLTAERIAAEGGALEPALQAFAKFGKDSVFWAWGKDEFNAVAISCYVAGISPPIPATRFNLSLIHI